MAAGCMGGDANTKLGHTRSFLESPLRPRRGWHGCASRPAPRPARLAWEGGCHGVSVVGQEWPTRSGWQQLRVAVAPVRLSPLVW